MAHSEHEKLTQNVMNIILWAPFSSTLFFVRMIKNYTVVSCAEKYEAHKFLLRRKFLRAELAERRSTGRAI